MLPERLYRQIAARAVAVRASRSPRNAWLDYCQSPGSLQITIDELTGLERYIGPGEMMTIDDGTINFVCTVPLVRPGDKCWEKFGVMVGRWQFLLVVDHRTYTVVGFNFTARPRSSYRAEDLVATLHPVFQAHGRPRVMILEKGISAANLVSDCLRGLDVRILRASSPHQKVVESVFNILWTKLSLQPGQVGRFRGETEAENRLLQSCRAGYTDPREHFLPLSEVLRALRAAIDEYNSTVKSGRYGRWVPREWFDREAPAMLGERPLDPNTAWLFSPVVTEPRKVNGRLVRATVPLMEGYTQKFHFSLGGGGATLRGAQTGDQGSTESRPTEFDPYAWHDQPVKLYFNPLAPDCTAAVVHAETGKLICREAQLIDREARMTRRALEYGMDPDIGRADTANAARALRRVSQSVGGKTVLHVEQRETVGQSCVSAPSEAAQQRRPTTEDRAERRAALAEFERNNSELLV